MPLAPGDNLGPYQILEPLGKGGMGEVCRAFDPRLKREVAIKTSTEKFNERFAREARAIAALNHPNICTLYDIGPDYLVMELVEGSSPKGPMPLEEALKVRRLLRACLQKEPSNRLSSIGHWRLLLDEGPVVRASHSRLPWAVAALCLVSERW